MDEIYAPVVRHESIRILLTYACYINFKLYQINVKSAFLNDFIKETVFVEQPPDFEHENFPNHVFKLKKALYGLKQAPRVWYDRLKSFLWNFDFDIDKVDTTLFIKRIDNDILLIQIYINDIIFGSTNDDLYQEFSKTMQNEFEMDHMGELSYFLGLQIKQLKEDISSIKTNMPINFSKDLR